MTGRLQKFALAKYRTAIVGLSGLTLFAEWLTHAAPHSLLTLADVEHFLGVGLMGTGLALRSWAAGFLIKRDVLTTTGPYAILRHPMYLGTLLLMLGFAELLEDRKALFAALLLFAITHVPAMLEEERYLAARFGNRWVKYKSCTHAFVPIGRSGGSRSGWDWQKWRRSNEWACWCLSVLLITALQTAATQ